MLESQFFKEVATAKLSDSPLYKLVEEMKNTETDVSKLDEPVVKDVNKKVLSEENKLKIKEETGWSDNIVNAISSLEEYKIYKEANLVEAEINSRPCLTKKDINPNQKDNMGRANEERMKAGLSPLDKDGRPIELHHIGQKPDSPLAELTLQEHRGKGNDTILHDKNKESEINRQEFAIQKKEHWANRG